jgi:hypothetical protein
MAMLSLLVVAHGVVNAQNVTRWSWQKPHSIVLPTGDIEWAPKPFEFKAGPSVRYIDFESGIGANDGQWHHVIAEADRKAGTFTIYLDGKPNATGPGLKNDASLENEADLYVGGAPNGH